MANELDKSSTKEKTKAVLLKRFKKQVERLLAEYETLSCQSACQRLGINVTPRSSSLHIQDLVSHNSLVAFVLNDAYHIPTFQFDSDNTILPSILRALPEINRRNISHLDYCFWLTNQRSVMLKTPKLNRSFKGLSYEEVMEISTRQQVNSVTFEGKPIDAAKGNDEQVFSMLIDEWLNTDTYDIYKGGS
jgi:hypothetical protein